MLTTLDLVLAELSQQSNETILPDAQTYSYILRAITYANNGIETYCARRFVPYVDTISTGFINGTNVIGDVLYFNHDLLELTSIAVDGVVVDQDTFVLEPRYVGSKRSARLVGQSYSSWRDLAVKKYGEVSIAGTWAYHSMPNFAWINSGNSIQNNPLLSTATSITVIDVDGQNQLGYSPRFSIGQLLKIGAEYMYVVGVDALSKTLSVVRGVQGTTVAQHAQNTVIFTFNADPDMSMRQRSLWLMPIADAHPVQQRDQHPAIQ
jgi:hypothetical protein